MKITDIDTKEFKLGNHSIKLQVSPLLFMPNRTTELFPKVISINPGDVVFDIGSGVGPLAIWSALEPSSRVYAVEIVPDQYKLLEKNIILNMVEGKVNAYNGSFFEPIPSGIKAEVIMADVSGLAEKPARASGWYPTLIPTGGEDGTETIISVFNDAGSFLTENGSLYFPIGVGFSDREKILDTARSSFGKLELMTEKSFPLPQDKVETIIDSAGSAKYINDLVNKGTRYLWKAEIYKASEPK